MAALLTGRTLGGRYRITHPISRGGMGAVYEAVDERIGRRVAIKVLLDELVDDTSAMERFRREARAIASVTHPALVALFDLSLDVSPAFLVMELVEGPSLGELLSSLGRLPWPRAARLVADVLDALEALHAAGIVHRDLKPANVLCIGVGADERAKVIDLGVAQLAMGAACQRLTASGALVGTPAYMAPEQLAGEAVGPAADLWAAGALLYTAIAGQRPFTSDDYAQLLGAVHTQAPTPITTLAPDAPREIEAITDELMRRHPSERPAPRAVAVRLRALAQLAPTAPPAIGERSWIAASGAGSLAPPRVERGPVPGERTRAIARNTRVGWLAAAFAALGVVTTCAVGIALAALFVAWRNDRAPALPAIAPTARPTTIHILYRGDDAETVQSQLGPVLDPALLACLPHPEDRTLGETTGFLVSLDRDGVPNRVQSTMMMASATSTEVACLDAAIRGARWPAPQSPFAVSTIILTVAM